MARESYEAKATRLKAEIIELRARARELETELGELGNAKGFPAAEAMARVVIDLDQASRRLR